MAKILKQYTNYTGGAYGADTIGDVIGRKHGFINHIHFRPYDNPNVSLTLRKVGISGLLLNQKQTIDGRLAVNKILSLNLKNNIAGNLQGRNYYQVINADSIYCFSNKSSNNSITGGTNTAFQLGIYFQKPVYLYNILDFKWYQYNYNTHLLEIIDIPVLAESYALVGTRNIEDYKIKSNNDWISRPDYIGDIKSDIVKDAIEILYLNTLNSL